MLKTGLNTTPPSCIAGTVPPPSDPPPSSKSGIFGICGGWRFGICNLSIGSPPNKLIASFILSVTNPIPKFRVSIILFGINRITLNIFSRTLLINSINPFIFSMIGFSILPGFSIIFISATRAPPSSIFLKKFNIISRNPPIGLVAFSAFFTVLPTLGVLLSNFDSLSFLSVVCSILSACFTASSLSLVCSLVLPSISSKFSSMDAKLGASILSVFFCSSFSDFRSSMTACFSSLSFLISSKRSSNLLSKSSAIFCTSFITSSSLESNSSLMV